MIVEEGRASLLSWKTNFFNLHFEKIKLFSLHGEGSQLKVLRGWQQLSIFYIIKQMKKCSLQDKLMPSMLEKSHIVQT